MTTKKQTIGIIGLWHLGCSLAASWSQLGKTVIGFDYNPERINNLQKGIPPIFEPHLKRTIQKSIDKHSLTFSPDITSLAKCDFVFVAHDTPVNDDDTCDTTILEKSIRDIRSILKNDTIVVVSSQSPVSYCSTLRRILQEKNSTLELAYSPENLQLGKSIECYLNPGRIILGTSNKKTEQKCINLFQDITDNILPMAIESAEMVKHGINSFLSTSIVFSNHLADICEQTNANINDVVHGIKSDLRIGPKAYLSPGIGFSGGTLGRDLKVLSSTNAKHRGFASLFDTIYTYNSKRKHGIIDKVIKILGNIENKTIGILGLTYKPGTSTIRRSIPLEIAEILHDKKAIVKAYDPKADLSELSYKPKFTISKNIKDVSQNANLLLLLTEWPDFKEYDWTKIVNTMSDNIFFDAKNSLSQSNMEKMGFNYFSVGKNNGNIEFTNNNNNRRELGYRI
jgi:UDPglucose 6-dehydrogenase